ncbi:MAG: pilus assembly PilX N-terminal domain-containing protein [Gallionella sp.]|nr:pilus assembly PilX N-terminal domain-containing protein [Gallionella sp.]
MRAYLKNPLTNVGWVKPRQRRTQQDRSDAIPRTQRGFLLITAVILIVVVALLATVITFLTTGNVLSSAGHANSAQALFLAESGLEYEQLRLAQNVDWYRSTTDPIATSPRNLGAGTFTVYSNLPATMLRRRLNSASTAVCVYTIDRWPTSGYVQIDNDITAVGEFVRYTGTTSSVASCGNRPALTGIARDQTIFGVKGSNVDHDRGSPVYPVTPLITNLGLSCTAPSTIQIVDHLKFLTVGTISLTDLAGNTEEISYTGSTRAGGVMTLTGVTRCSNVTGPFAYAPNFPVTPLLDDGTSPDFEAQIFASGAVGSATRQESKSIQR